MASKEIQVDEDLPNFFTSIKLSQADEVVLEYQNLRRNYGIEINDPKVVETLDATTMPKKAIQGTAWYDVLSNKKYTEDFQYIGAHIEEREKLINTRLDNDYDFEQSDVVIILLNLSCIPDEVA